MQLQLPAAEARLRFCEALLGGLKLDDAEVVIAEARRAKFAAELARDEISLAVERLAEQIIDWSQQLPAAEELLQACEIALQAARLACDESGA